MKRFFLNPKLATIVFFTIIYSSVNATVYPINVTFSGQQETPANNSTATGTFVGTYNDVTDSLIYTVTFSGLSSNVIAAHFHGFVPPGILGSVIFFPVNPAFPTGVMSATFVDSVKLTQGQEDSLKMGLIYFNIHTSNFSGGEIRAQLFLQNASFVLPDISCPADITANTDPGVCTANVTFAATTTVAGTPASVIYYRIGNTAITSPRVFPLGTTTVIATALNGAGYDSCSFKIVVRDVQLPVITCPANITLPNAPGQCGAVATYSVTATDNCGSPTVTVQPTSGSFFAVGTTTVNARATDASGNTSTCSFTVTVNDVEPPVIHDLAVTPPVLWPPNHNMKNVNVDYTSTDNCPGPITCHITVTSDEPENGTGDGDTAPDWELTDDHHIKLRAERAGNGDGRVYTVTVTCTDQHGNSSSGNKKVMVPKNMSVRDIRLLVFQYWTQGHGHGQGHRLEAGSASDKNVVIMNEDDPERSTLVRAYPNPSTSYFTLNIETGNDKDKISVRLIDVAGRIIETRNNLSGSQVVRIGNNLKAGLYIAEIRQGNSTRQIKLLKQ
ncbi:MAG TPA: CHRD domain-containing protein [Chitinophagaceae bacterium]|nr:CHRD domain-containing protein [Chitinophagaceae bacterium]